MGSPGGIEVDVDGEHLWAVVRCGNDGTPRGSQTYCDKSDLDPIIKFDPDGNAVTMFGSRMFAWPHGMHVDRDGNIWVTEAGSGESEAEPGRIFGHQVFKFSPQGEILMTLGEAGVPGDGPNHFTAPSDVVTAPNGDIFVADGHGTDGNNRIVKYSKDGDLHQGVRRNRAWSGPAVRTTRYRHGREWADLRRRPIQHADCDLRSGR